MPSRHSPAKSPYEAKPSNANNIFHLENGVAATRYTVDLHGRSVTPAGAPILSYLIRVSSDMLIALALKLKNTSGIDFASPEKPDELEMIVRVFLPSNVDED
jgi:hypothetical protein